MSTFVETGKETEEIVTEPEQLLKYFTSSYKDKKDWKVGTEYEKFVIGYPGFKPLSYDDKFGIRNILLELSKNYDWEPFYEGENIIALFNGKSNITLEPGGQIELSGRPFYSLHDSSLEIEEHVNQLKEISKDWDVAWYSSGMNPFNKNEDIPWVPKERYKVMKKYLPTKGHLAHMMMKQTSTIQANFDYGSEADAIKKLRVSTGINSIVTAIFANSAIYDGKFSGRYTNRSHIWEHTDSDRCGIIENLFDENFNFKNYIDYVLDNNMFFVLRNNKIIDMTHLTFREYMKKGDDGKHATYGDWLVHVTTVFPEVRLLKYIEVRGADSQSMDLCMAIPALWKGILYSEKSLDSAWDLVKNLNYSERVQWHDDISKYGLQAKVKGIMTKDLAKELFDISYQGLKEQNVLNSNGDNETVFLKNLEEKVIKTGKSPAETLVDKWKNNDASSLDKLLNHCII